MYDVIIIGKGPAGISAGLYTKRAGLETLIIGKDLGALSKADKIENYYGLESFQTGEQLAQNGIQQAKQLGINIITDEVVDIKLENNFKSATRKEIFESKAVILATGTNRVKPRISGIKEYEGKGISYCAVCDAFFYRGKDVAILGSGDYATSEIKELLPIVKSITVLTNGNGSINYRSEKVKIEQRPIREFRGNTVLQDVVFEDETSIPVSGVFIAEGTASSTDFARKLGAIIENEKIKVNEYMQTNIPGLYAAGDCTGGMLQISKAVHNGAVAGLQVVEWIRKNKDDKN